SAAQIEIIPCKVCGDKSSGVHYGVITCEGCKVRWFRQLCFLVLDCDCAEIVSCMITRLLKARKHSRLNQPLLALLDSCSVKFGRMSKKQREKVEDEVRFHRAQLVRPQGATPGTSPQGLASAAQGAQATETSPDSSVFDQQQTPSSSNQAVPFLNGGWVMLPPAACRTRISRRTDFQWQMLPSSASILSSVSPPLKTAVTRVTRFTQNNGRNFCYRPLLREHRCMRTRVSVQKGQYSYPEELTSYTPNGYAYTATPATIQFEMSTDYVDSTTFEQRQQMDPTPDTNGLLSTTATTTTTVVPASSLASHLDLLAKTVSDAHSRTCLYTTEHIQDLTRKPLDISRVMLYKNMAHEELWLDCAQKLTQVIQQIIEFAKMVPGFMKLSQDDQIVLLKAGSFELCVLRMSRYFDVPTGLVLYNDSLLPMDAFITQETLEIKLVNNAFNFVRSIAEMKLTETELALYSAYVLLAPADRPGLKGVPEITRLSTAILKSLRYELDKTHEQPYKGDVSVFDSLVAKLPSLREVSLLHMDALAKFRRSVPHLEFPALHKELFSVDV
ncbi:unnamed protein product, partial [Ixodes hexagonus]